MEKVMIRFPVLPRYFSAYPVSWYCFFVRSTTSPANKFRNTKAKPQVKEEKVTPAVPERRPAIDEGSTSTSAISPNID